MRFQDNNFVKKQHHSGDLNVSVDSQENYYLNVSGLGIKDYFQLIDEYGTYHENIYTMSVMEIGGVNSDYYGLDFCEGTSKRIVDSIFSKIQILG